MYQSELLSCEAARGKGVVRLNAGIREIKVRDPGGYRRYRAQSRTSPQKIAPCLAVLQINGRSPGCSDRVRILWECGGCEPPRPVTIPDTRDTLAVIERSFGRCSERCARVGKMTRVCGTSSCISGNRYRTLKMHSFFPAHTLCKLGTGTRPGGFRLTKSQRKNTCRSP